MLSDLEIKQTVVNTAIRSNAVAMMLYADIFVGEGSAE